MNISSSVCSSISNIKCLTNSAPSISPHSVCAKFPLHIQTPREKLVRGIISQAVLIAPSTFAYAVLTPLIKAHHLHADPRFPSFTKVGLTAATIVVTSALVVNLLIPYSKRVQDEAHTFGEKVGALTKVVGWETALSMAMFPVLGQIYDWKLDYSLIIGGIRGFTKGAPAGMINKRWGGHVLQASFARAIFNLLINTGAGYMMMLAQESHLPVYRSEVGAYGALAMLAAAAIYAKGLSEEMPKSAVA